jgi:hypothetical protein
MVTIPFWEDMDPNREVRGSRFRVGCDWDLLAADRLVSNRGSRSTQAEAPDGSGVGRFDGRADPHGPRKPFSPNRRLSS